MKPARVDWWDAYWARLPPSYSGAAMMFVAGSPQCSNIPTGERSQFAMIWHRRGGVLKRVTSRELNQDVSRAKRFALVEPVFVTDRGRPTHVLISIDAWRQLSGERENMAEIGRAHV